MSFKMLLIIPFFWLFERIRLVEYDITFIPTKKNEFRSFTLDDSSYIKIHLYNERGSMLLERYTPDSILSERGNYVESLDLLKTYTIAVNATSQRSRMEVSKYFQPLRNGKWEFFKEGKAQYYIIYSKGIKIDSVISKD